TASATVRVSADGVAGTAGGVAEGEVESRGPVSGEGAFGVSAAQADRHAASTKRGRSLGIRINRARSGRIQDTQPSRAFPSGARGRSGVEQPGVGVFGDVPAQPAPVEVVLEAEERAAEEGEAARTHPARRAAGREDER